MNNKIDELIEQCTEYWTASNEVHFNKHKFAELILQNMHRKVIASILITDVLMEEKGQTPTSEDYIRAINKDFGIK